MKNYLKNLTGGNIQEHLKMDEIKAGMIIKLNEENHEYVKNLQECFNEQREIYGRLIDYGSEKFLKAEKEFWKSLHEIFPELENWMFRIDSFKGKIYIQRVLTISEKETRDRKLKND